MPRFLGFPAMQELLIDVDWLADIDYDSDREEITFWYKDGSDRQYKMTPEAWQRFRAKLKSLGLIEEM